MPSITENWPTVMAITIKGCLALLHFSNSKCESEHSIAGLVGAHRELQQSPPTTAQTQYKSVVLR
jgi:hypothetical protein